MDTTELHENLRKKIVSLIKHRREEINHDHDGNSDFLCTCQQSDGTVETESSALPEVAAISQAPMKHTATE